ncbi:MAG TPA: NUDIX domain-containing protein [Anaerolineaceae bacterium]|nr:NUDIX domain-containing protein [Anaerolineaceae bacterium]
MFSIGAFAIIFDENGNVLISHRRDIDAWNLPGGGVETRELPNEAVIREVKEETGLDVVILRLVGVYGKVDKDEIIFAFICRDVGGQLVLSDEADQHCFFAIDKIPVNTPPKQVERIQDALNLKTQPIFRRQTAPSTQSIIGKA